MESLLISKQVYVPALIAVAIPLLIAVILGKVFCSWVCPISFLAEMLAAIRRRIQQKAMLRDRLVLARRLLWFALIGELLFFQILGAPLFVFLSPPGLVGRGLVMARLTAGTAASASTVASMRPFTSFGGEGSGAMKQSGKLLPLLLI